MGNWKGKCKENIFLIACPNYWGNALEKPGELEQADRDREDAVERQHAGSGFAQQHRHAQREADDGREQRALGPNVHDAS